MDLAMTITLNRPFGEIRNWELGLFGSTSCFVRIPLKLLRIIVYFLSNNFVKMTELAGLLEVAVFSVT